MKNTLFLVFLFVSFATISGCKDDAVTPSESYGLNSDPIFTANIDGRIVKFESGKSYIGISNSSSIGSGAGGSGGSSFSFGSSFSNLSETHGVEISKGTILVPEGGFYDQEDFKVFFPTGDVEYAENEQGIVISYFYNEVYYSTELGSQSGSQFTIAGRRLIDNLGEYEVKFVAGFSCTLYDDEGNSIALADGKCVGYFGE